MTRSSQRRVAVAIATLLLGTGCADDDHDGGPISMVGAVTVVSSDIGDGTELHDNTLLAKDVTYAVPDTFSDQIDLTVTSPTGGISTRTSVGLFGAYNDVDGLDMIVEVLELERAFIITNPAIDIVNLPSGQFPDGSYAAVPADVLEWFAGQAGVTASPVADVSMFGFPARTLTYQIGPVPDAVACFPGSDAGCLTWFATDSDISTLIIWPVGYRGTLYEVDVPGDRLLVHVRDRINAAETAAGLTLEIAAPTVTTTTS